MAATAPSWTEDDIGELKDAIKSGVLRVRFSGPPAREVEYQDLRAMRELLSEMVREVCGTTTHRLIEHSRGFC